MQYHAKKGYPTSEIAFYYAFKNYASNTNFPS